MAEEMKSEINVADILNALEFINEDGKDFEVFYINVPNKMKGMLVKVEE